MGYISYLKVLTVEKEPKIIELYNDEIQKVQHAYGTNGIVLEMELALSKAKDLMSRSKDIADKQAEKRRHFLEQIKKPLTFKEMNQKEKRKGKRPLQHLNCKPQTHTQEFAAN